MSATGEQTFAPGTANKDNGGVFHDKTRDPQPDVVEVETGTVTSASKKTYMQKLRLFEPGVFSKPNRLLPMVLRPFYYLSFPLVLWCGVAYGSALGTFLFLSGDDIMCDMTTADCPP